MVTMVLSSAVGGAVRERSFERALPSYEAIIRQIEAGSISVSTNLQHVPQAEGDGVYRAFAYRSTNGALTVEFWTGSGFPSGAFGLFV